VRQASLLCVAEFLRHGHHVVDMHRELRILLRGDSAVMGGQENPCQGF
jgi:hypothetical protein